MNIENTTPIKVISADSHVAEREFVFADTTSKYRESMPFEIYNERHGGAILVVPGIEQQLPMALLCTAGRPSSEIIKKPVGWHELHPGAIDPKARLKVQDQENVLAEVIFPSVGMLICNHPDMDYRKVCFEAYNRWIFEFSSHSPERLLGVPLISIRTIAEGLNAIQHAKDNGARAVMFPGNAVFDDYDHVNYDPIWELCAALNLPVCFHILASSSDLASSTRGSNPKAGAMVRQLHILRGNQDIMAMLIFGGVFTRHPTLKVVCVEADGGWVPHFLWRLNHAYEIHRHYLGLDIGKGPSEYFFDNIYLTFQDDLSVAMTMEGQNPNRLMFATDFPHADGTFPHSQSALNKLCTNMSLEVKEKIAYKNAAELFSIVC
ncbi:hypothetical protein PSECIP111854_03980 [Pseudoalteromonas sp. CIP111854]|uniref:Amidohydrolase-related domain-containing protein n=1 Tax=Pseudoalteromonas holothuriae TaxID=2963714 RepID=A0A9W4VW28_9GAMM|nr:amidohydrolase family protein [Pseudoalteromonas sp. CIP111854]CAH9066885.1 hypothetical protein PSECIP111854_03980 [Pseudoalteromonas sp. CIP111854]